LVIVYVLLEVGAGDPDPNHSTFVFYPFSRHEPVHFAMLLGLLAASPMLFRARPASLAQLRIPSAALTWRSVALVGVGVTAMGLLGALTVFHGYVFTQDEYVADFQARVFAAGQIQAAIPADWLPFVQALTPVYVVPGPGGDTWTSSYLPVAAAIRALFVLAGAPALTNPVLAGLTIPLIWLVARRLWPDDPIPAIVPPALLAASPQFLFTSMSAYSMSAHLFMNAAWLYLYVLGTRLSLAVAGVVGILAIGLHQPHVHALFVAPFLLRLLLARRWGAAAYFAGAYLLAGVLWAAWWFRFNPSIGGVPSAVFALPGVAQFVIQPIAFALLVSWQPLALTLLTIVALLRWRRMNPLMRDLALSALLTVGFYFFVDFDQGQGWGYRYAYSVLGNIVLLAGYGWTTLSDDWRRTVGRGFIAASVLFALLVQAPIRAVQIESFIRPFAESMAFIRSLPADVALVDQTEAWYAKDLVRNDPWLTNHTKIMWVHRLSPAQRDALERTAVVHKVEPAELKRLGMFVSPVNESGQ